MAFGRRDSAILLGGLTAAAACAWAERGERPRRPWTPVSLPGMQAAASSIAGAGNTAAVAERAASSVPVEWLGAAPELGAFETSGRVTLRVSHGFYTRMMTLGHATGKELTLFGALEEYPDDGELYVPEAVFVPEQRCSSSTTEVLPEAMARVRQEAREKQIAGSALVVWVHYHNDMKCFWSAQDVETMTRRFGHARHVLSIVYNAAGEMLARLCMFAPVRLDIDIKHVIVGLPRAEEQALLQEGQEKIHAAGAWAEARRS